MGADDFLQRRGEREWIANIKNQLSEALRERDEARKWARHFLKHAAVVASVDRSEYEQELPWLKEEL